MHINASPGFCLAIKVCFKKSGKNYGDFDRHWLPACTNDIRRLIDQGMPLAAVNTTIRDTQNRSRSFVYRRTKTDFLRHFWGLLKEVLCKRIVAEFMRDDAFEWPDVLMMHRDTMHNIFRIVSATNPHDKDFDYAPALAELGCRRETIELVKSIEERFNGGGGVGGGAGAADAGATGLNAAVFETELDASLDEVQHLVQRVIQLDEGRVVQDGPLEQARWQEEAPGRVIPLRPREVKS